jgi:hypothetical protein
MTVCEAEVFKDGLLPLMGADDTIAVLGGTVSGSGNGIVIQWSADGGHPVPLTSQGWAFVIEVRCHDHVLVCYFRQISAAPMSE